MNEHPENELQEDVSNVENLEMERVHWSNIPVVQQLSVALGILIIVFGATYIEDVKGAFTKTLPEEEATHEASVYPEARAEKASVPSFEEVDISAQAAFVWDVASQRVLFSKNPDKRLPLASVTKLMTALVAYELMEGDEVINISVEALGEEGDSGLTDGEQFSFQDLTDLVLVGSSNDGAHALAAAAGNSLDVERSGTEVFIEAMNIRAEELGLSATHFNNTTGLDLTTTEAGAYGSARDMTFLMEYILINYPDLLALTTKEDAQVMSEEGQSHSVQNTNEVVGKIEGLLGSKTGYTDLAGGNLVVAFDAGLNRPIVVTVLGSTQKARFSDILTLAEKAREVIVHETNE